MVALLLWTSLELAPRQSASSGRPVSNMIVSYTDLMQSSHPPFFCFTPLVLDKSRDHYFCLSKLIAQAHIVRARRRKNHWLNMSVECSKFLGFSFFNV